jgi:ribonuclease BN (tRNA processing enzyme)
MTRQRISKSLLRVVMVWVLLLSVHVMQGQMAPGKAGTQVVLLGTGNPFPDPDRSGPATAIVVNGNAYLVDFGPGVVRRAKAAVIDKGITALEPANLRVAFVTHLHSDHTVGYPDLIFTPWVIGRKMALEVYGPKGIKDIPNTSLQPTAKTSKCDWQQACLLRRTDTK